jgi:hypothetical protein
VACLTALAATGGGAAQAPAGKDDEAVARVQRLLTETDLDLKGFPEKTTLARALAEVQARLPRDRRISIRLDEHAFGKDRDRLAEAPVTVPARTSSTLADVLNRIVRQVPKGLQVDYGVRPNGVLLTRPRLAGYRMVYDVRDLVGRVPSLLPQLKRGVLAGQGGDVYEGLTPDDGPAVLVRELVNDVDLRPWDSVEVLNQTGLVVHAAAPRQVEVVYLLAALRRLADVAVVMNARLYEVDRTVFDRQVVPLFSGSGGGARPAVVAVEAPLYKEIKRQKVLLESEEVRIRPDVDTRFLSKQGMYRFVAAPRRGPDGKPGVRTATGLEGVTFDVRARVSGDRRHVGLRITQHVTQLLGIDKSRVLDLSTEKEVEVEVPNLRKTTVTGDVRVPDTGAVLMPVEYQPPGKQGAGKVWMLVARPLIWIEEEVKAIRKQGGSVSAKGVWESGLPEDEPPVGGR